ncbi:PA3496 family putative envelope integrity protein [Neptuniibacter sp. PT8_73]|uniref:PA3496 family putative envelope integrity protein n=1 Tax=unclassified Neptuniibacter TaxID=2630693 RepID=UPI0039F70692
MLHKTEDLNETQVEVFDLLVGFEEEEKLSRKKLATRRALRARRAIEQHQEEKELASHIDECWFDE